MEGYKCFNKDRTNRYGKQFVEGETYTASREIGYGNDRYGYHMCKNLSDVFRFFDVKSGDYSVAQVTGIGKCVSSGDEDYYGYSDMFSFESIRINKFLTREEIIEKMLECDIPYLLQHFFQTFPLTEDERIRFAKKYRTEFEIMRHLLYYQFGFQDAYYYNSSNYEEVLKRINMEQTERGQAYGQDSNQGCERKQLKKH